MAIDPETAARVVYWAEQEARPHLKDAFASIEEMIDDSLMLEGEAHVDESQVTVDLNSSTLAELIERLNAHTWPEAWWEQIENHLEAVYEGAGWRAANITFRGMDGDISCTAGLQYPPVSLFDR